MSLLKQCWVAAGCKPITCVACFAWFFKLMESCCKCFNLGSECIEKMWNADGYLLYRAVSFAIKIPCTNK